MEKHTSAAKRVLPSSLALLVTLSQLSWPTELHAQSADNNAAITGKQSNSPTKPSERYKNELFWQSISKVDREILDQFGINAASILYRYANKLEAALIELGSEIENPLPTKIDILKQAEPAPIKTTDLPAEMDQTSVTLIRRFGFGILSTLNSKSIQLEDTLLESAKKQPDKQHSPIDITQVLRTMTNPAKGDEDERSIDMGEIRLMAARANELQYTGQYDAATEIWVLISGKLEKALGPDHLQTATSLNNLASLYQEQGFHAKAEPLFIRALAITEKALGPDHPDTATSLNNLALLNTDQGLYAKAEPLFIRALSITQKELGPYHPSTAANLGNLASLYRYQGLHAKAEPLFIRALAIKEKALGPDHPDTANGLENLAFLYTDQGLYAKAEPLFFRGLAITEKALGPDHPSTAVSLGNLALLYKYQGLYAKAEPLFIRALAITEKALGPDHPDTATSLNNLASLYQEQGFHARAEPLFIRALAITEKALGPDHPDTATSLNNLAVIYSNQGLYAKAVSALSQGLEIESTWLTRELPILTDQRREYQVKTLGGSWLYTFTLASHYPQATELALKTRLNRQGLLAEIARRQTMIANAPGIDQSKAQQLQALTQQLSSISIESDLRITLREQRDNLQAELNRQFPDLQIQIVTPEEVAQALPTGTSLVEFQRYRPFDGRKPREQRWGEAQYIALVLTPSGSVTSVQLGPAAAIDESIHKALAASAQDQRDAEALWSQVSDRILRPLLPHLSGSRQWFISPDGELNRVPFAALPAPQQPDIPLAEAVQLRLITTGRELVRLQKANPAGNKPLVMANPSFDRQGVSTSITTIATASQEPRRRSADLSTTRWSALPASQQEGQQIASLLSTPLISGAAATTSALQRQQGPRVLHIATHGFFVADKENKPADTLQFVQEQAPQLQGLRQEDPQLRSGLVLAGANQPDTDPNDDGYLTAAEALLLNLKGTELVVLSACSTGQGDIRTGEGVYGLQRSLTVAGARSTLLSLWKVDDAATADFMKRFYTRLKAGDARSDALAAAQKEFRDGIAGNGQWTSPYYWAAWQLVGDWRPITGL